MSNLSFAFEGQEIRFVGTPDTPEWVANDVLAALHPEIAKQNRASLLRKIPAKWKGLQKMQTLRGMQNTITLYEPGLYHLVARSNSPKAVAFQDWLYEEVLPSIRKTGGYALPPNPTEPTAALPTDLTDLILETNRLYGELEAISIEPTPVLIIAKEIGDRLLYFKEQVGHGGWKAFMLRPAICKKNGYGSGNDSDVDRVHLSPSTRFHP